MSTVRETFGLACPRCGSDDSIEIWAYTVVALMPNGSAATNDPFHEWGPDHYCACRACTFEGRVADFTIPHKEGAR